MPAGILLNIIVVFLNVFEQWYTYVHWLFKLVPNENVASYLQVSGQELVNIFSMLRRVRI